MHLRQIIKLVFIIILFLLEGNIISQTVERSFEGIPWSDKRPPDPEIAVGPSHVVLVVNSLISIYSKDGTQLSSNSLLNFFSSKAPPGDPFDPRIVYDHLSSRWVVYCLSRTTNYVTSNYLVAASQTSDPTGGWYYYKFDARKDNSTNTDNWADFTGLGYNQEAVYITSNQMYIAGDFQYAKIRAIKKSDLYTGATSPTFKDFVGMTDASGKTSESIKPVHQFGTTSEFYLMNSANDITANYVTVWAIINPFGANPTITRKATINVGQYNPPSGAVQKNSNNTIDTQDSRMSDCIYKDGSLYGCFTARNSSNNGTAIKYFKINTNNFSLEINDVIEDQNIYYYYPEIYPDLNNNIIIVFNKSSLNDYVGIAWTYRYANTSAIGGISWLKQGEAAYYNLLNDTNRWGDYSGICLDPTDNKKVWVYGEYAKTAATWSTWVGMINMTLLIPTQFSNLITTQNAGGSLIVNSTTNVNSGQSLSIPQGTNNVKTNNERFANWSGSGLTYKHNNWNDIPSEKFLSYNFMANFGSVQNQKANFIDLKYAKVEIQLDNISFTGQGILEFQDPWYVKSDGSQPETYWIQATSPYEPTGKAGATEKGVFSNQSGAPSWAPPYYSIRAQSTPTINGKTCYFQNWGTTGANVQYPTALETPVVFTAANAFVSANYKGTGLSNNNNAYSNNSQNKFVRSSDGWLHNVYESMGKVWYETSSNNGVTWQIMNGGKPLSSSDAKLPAITFFENNWSIITYQKNNGGTYALETAVYNYPGDGFHVNQPVLAFQSYASYQSTSNPAVVHGQQSSNEYIALVWQTTSSDGTGWDPGLYYRLAKYEQLPNYSYGYVWKNSPTKVPNTNVYSVNPTVTVNNNGTATPGIIDFHIAWQQNNPSYPSQSVIKYIQMNVNWSNNTTTFANYYEASSGSGYLSNYKPSITMYGTYPAIAWIADHTQTLIPQAVLRIKFTSWSTFYSYSYSGGDNVECVSINRVNNGFALGWGGDQRENQYITNNSTTNIYSLSTTGDVQVANADVLGNIKVMAFNKYNSPYSFTPAAITQGLSKGGGKSYVNREAVIKRGGGEYYFSFGDIAVDNYNINFVQIKDSLFGADKKSINNYLLTEPFALNDNSNLSFNVEYGIKDSTSFAVNKDRDNPLKFKLELIDEQNEEVLGILNEVSTGKDEFMRANNSSRYSIDTKGIGDKKVRLRLSTENDFDDFMIITKVNKDKTLPKAATSKTLAFNGETAITDYALFQNYPNPFNPTTTINYQIKEKGFVQVKVYDILGEKVATLVNESKSAGFHNVSFDASKLTSGIYIYTISTNNFIQSKKMLLMK